MVLFIMVYIIYMVYRSMEAMHMLQQNLYNENNRYIRWIRKNLGRAFCLYDFIPIVFFVFIYIIDEKSVTDFILIASMFIYMYCIYNEYRKNKENQNKIPLKITGRIKRLFFTVIIIYGIPIVFVIKITNPLYLTMMLIMLVLILGFNYYMIFFASILDTPFNQIEFNYFYKKAKKKLNGMPYLPVIGITGSYGKTSSKNILNEILSSKYISKATPKNYNTLSGLMMSVNNYLDKFDEIFIAEMGAYTKGDIKKLCDFVKPKYGILTVIGESHLETFGTIENVCKTKFELIESLPSDGLAILNMDDSYQVNYPLKNNVPIKWISINNDKADVYASNIKCSKNGMMFDCHYGDEKVTLRTRILGEYNIYNILSSVALALHLGIDINDIKASVNSLKATEHRLELKKVGNMYMLDDAYNSNPVGASGAIDVLNLMPGTKVVVTPGMVELGDLEKEKNYEFGKKISEVADYCILVGEKRTKVIKKALLEKGFDEDNIFIINKVIDAYAIIDALKEEKKDIYALFENDLPDIYTEGGRK